ncbi:phosphotransferase family protein [Paucisalibacillus globulus]|uniref:phosphotransferase family protein n=1 Tax=Paucisalibacillus globulus TaxID=351095 RepID=UPI000BB9109E|nr:aminoglycoside phosphotransferase family protein [Paucisalibacillus globulus]
MLNRVLKQFRLQVLSLNEVDESFSSTVYKCQLLNGRNVYIKIPYSKLKWQRELEAYEILKDRVATPVLLDVWSGDEECPGAFLLSELRGVTLSTNVSTSVAYQVGVLQASIHTIRPPKDRELTGIKDEYSNWSNFIERQFNSFAKDVKDVIDERLFEQAIEKFDNMKRQLPSPDGPSFVHMDFRPANILIDGDHVSGVIDFESVRFGSTEIDFTKLYRDFLSFDNTYYHAYQEGYKSIRPLMDLEVVLPFYQFTDAFNSIGWCKRRGIEEHAKFLNENITRLKQMVL